MAISSTTGISSGINYEQLITEMMKIERIPVNLLQSRQADYTLKISAVVNLITKLSAYKSSLEQLDSLEKFNTKTSSVTKTTEGTQLLSASVSSTAAVGSYDIQVNQLAAADKKAAQGWVDQNTTAIASGSGTFKFRVGIGGAETTISINDSMTLQGLRDAINSAGADVTASIINDGTGSNPYRLILTADNTGSSNTIYINPDDNDTNLDFSNKKVEAAYAYTTNTYSGTVASNEGNYTGTTNKTFLIKIVTGGTPALGSAEYKYSIDGGITWLGSGGAAYSGSNGVTVAAEALQNIDGLADGETTTEGAKIKFAGGTLAVEDKFSIDVFNPEMQQAKDAVIEIDNATIVKSTNTISDAIQGVTLNLLKVDTSESVTFTISLSTSSAKSNIKSFVSSYNTVYQFINDQLVYDPDTEASADPLMGDSTLLGIRRKLGAISGTIPGLSSASYTNLSQIGITSNYKTGQLSIDETKLDNALDTDPDAVAKLFIGTAVPTNQAISFVSKTPDTQAGTYSINISTAPEKATLGGSTDENANDLSSVGLEYAETLTFLYSTNKTSSTWSYTTCSVTLAAGSTINSIVNSLNSAFATDDIGLSASNDSGKLKITSTGYGEDSWFQVSTDKGDATKQIWDEVGTRKDEGADIAGTINNHVATGVGNVLTAASGFAEDGLKISSTSNQTGMYGTIAVSLGIADRLPSILDSYVDQDSGVLKSKESSMQDTVDYLQGRISTLAARLEVKAKRYTAQFQRLEVVLAKYSVVSDNLTNLMTNLPKIWTKA